MTKTVRARDTLEFYQEAVRLVRGGQSIAATAKSLGDEGWLFLAVVIDLFSRQVVGWSMREDMTREMVIDALRMAWFKRHPSKPAGLIFHSDKGRPYASHHFSDLLKQFGLRVSMADAATVGTRPAVRLCSAR